LTFDLGDASDITSTEGESRTRKKEQREETEKERVWLDGSHDVSDGGVSL